ncbi:hypothetical protein T484DRAFT_1841149 [Baffinella frigidus]|nr:hypothetical protein T484DRAFT_1841149 [Cryptophyta sp. CCMP2293]
MERGRAPSAVVAAGRPDLNFFEKQGDLRTPEEWGAHGTGGEDGQRKLDFEEVLFVTAGNRGLAGLGDLPQCVNAEFVWVGGNSLRSITAVAPLLQLRLLDASKNALQRFSYDSGLQRDVESCG